MAFTIYNASAGAGKTYTLVREYLIRLFSTKRQDSFRSILAVTFTNKAVAEMKGRIIICLKAFGEEQTPTSYLSMQNEILDATNLDIIIFKKRATHLLAAILQNYAAFDVVTIDTFTHRIIRTFASELNLASNFEIELDSGALLEEAVDRLLTQIGKDPGLTKTLVDFSLSKLDDDKSWDISQELQKVGKLLFSENDREELIRLNDKTPQDFTNLHKTVRKRILLIQDYLQKSSLHLLQKIAEQGIEHKAFMRGSIPKHFEEFSNGNFSRIDYSAKWKQDITTTPFYAKALSDTKKALIDTLRPEIEKLFTETKELWHTYSLLHNIKKNLIPLSTLKAIQQAVADLKIERNILLIAEFNGIVQKAIRNEPAPFIYERLGERYQHFFIDEFQDTSVVQWENLVPLAANALATSFESETTGSITIVGDAKQAIYRWRGGKAEQFVTLSDRQSPFAIEDKQISVQNLPVNYRSYSEIIKFNNSFFTFLSKGFEDSRDQNLYASGNRQETNEQLGGYVQISFIEENRKEDKEAAYNQQIAETIYKLKAQNFLYKDICILTRSRQQGITIANYLADLEIPIVSSETLLIANAPEVDFIYNLLSLQIEHHNKQIYSKVLHHLITQFTIKEPNTFLVEMLALDLDGFCAVLETYAVTFSFEKLASYTLYNAVEYIITSFNLSKTPSVYLHYFLDVIFEFRQRTEGDIIAFLEYWEQKKDHLSISTAGDMDAIQIMTIHKSKGLEFSVVLYPFVEDEIYRDRNVQVWHPVPPADFAGFSESYISYSKRIADYSEVSADLVSHRRREQELDAINILYVAMTRAIERLYIYTIKEKGIMTSPKYSNKLMDYIKNLNRWNDAQLLYSFGTDAIKERSSSETDKSDTYYIEDFVSVLIEDHQLHVVTKGTDIWMAEQEDTTEEAWIIKSLLAKIQSRKDLSKIVEEALASGMITIENKEIIRNQLEQILSHELLAPSYLDEHKAINDRDILHKGYYYRQSRIAYTPKGILLTSYYVQSDIGTQRKRILANEKIMQKMGHQVSTKILVNLNKPIEVILV